MNNLEKKCENKQKIDKVIKYIFLCIAFLCVGIVIVTIFYLIYSGIQPFFKTYIVTDENGNQVTGHLDLYYFFFGNMWAKSEFQYGIGWVIVNTIYLTLISMIFAIPLSVLTGLFIVKIAPKWLGNILNTTVNILSGIPSVIIGVFGMGFICPNVRDFFNLINISTAGGKSILSACLVLTLMSFPTICSMTITSIKAVDNKLVLASYALGASNIQTNFKIVLTSSISGIFAGIVLGVGRVIGEATAIQMVTGASSGPSFLLYDNTATLTTVMITGLADANVESLAYSARFSVGLVLMIIIIGTNLLLNFVKNKIYQKQNGINKVKKTRK